MLTKAKTPTEELVNERDVGQCNLSLAR